MYFKNSIFDGATCSNDSCVRLSYITSVCVCVCVLRFEDIDSAGFLRPPTRY